MKILHVIPGSGGTFYCGNCLRDSKYVLAMRKLGHEVVKIPMYLPLFADEHDLRDVPVFYGAISIYLKQLYPVFRKAPGWMDKLLNSKPMLRIAARMAGSTRARGLEEMTLSMLMGEQGKQSEELKRMVDWISVHYRPDVLHLSNALLLGLASRLKEKMQVPLVCSLQDEDTWVDVMQSRVRDRVWQLMGEQSVHVDAFISVSDYYARKMLQQMKLPAEKLSTIHLGVDPADYRMADPASKPRNIGYLSRMCRENGLDVLVDAFLILKESSGFRDVRLMLTGGSTGDDRKFLAQLRKKLVKAGLERQVCFCRNFEDEGRSEFFDMISLLSVPVPRGEAFGIYLLEAMASGIPAVQPATGAFPEIIGLAGGGIVYEPNTPERLAEAMGTLLNDRDLLLRKSESAARGVRERFDIHRKAAMMIGKYKELTG